MATSSDATKPAVAVTDRSRVALSPEEIREECPQFRILVIGKANTGKTTILRKVCNASPDVKPIVRDRKEKLVKSAIKKEHLDRGNVEQAESSEIKPKGTLIKRITMGAEKLFKNAKSDLDVLRPSKLRGNHDVEYEITFPGSNFIFHDSEGFEAGGVDEVQKVNDFIKEKGGMKELAKQLHVIWYCISLDDQRPVTGGEKQFFQTAAGRVPVIVVFTKFDALVTKCWGELGEARMQSDAFDIADQRAKAKFEAEYLPLVMKTDHPPKTHVLLGGMDKEENKCPELSNITASALDNTVLQTLFVSTQMNNLDLCTEYAIGQVLGIDNVNRSVEDIVGYYPHFWSARNYKLLEEGKSVHQFAREYRRRTKYNFAAYRDSAYQFTRAADETYEFIIETLQSSFPKVFNVSTFNNVIHKLQIITIVCLIMEHTFWSNEEGWKLKIQSSAQVLLSQISMENLINDLTKEFGHLKDLSTAKDQIITFIIDRKLK